ncbi:DMT family transporter [Citricoccus sp.]|uniref:DMT family transporter n=1 Tax=Citricoccus sp. TaxID=1978372 RepID=UPI00260F700B|nr:DMT family transporter [Citricoccus sp.]HRO94843.1 DMT family transporter [Citricoccus sp.]
MGRSASLILALAGGWAIAIQARVTGALKLELGDAALAAAVTFGSGLALMIGVNVATRANRQGVARMVSGGLKGRYPAVFMFSGLLGAYAVFGQGASVDLIGVAVFSLVFIGGQMVASAVLDSAGWVPAGRTRLGAARLLGILVACAGVLLALSVRFDAGGRVDGGSGWVSDDAGTTGLLGLIVPLLIVFTGGLVQPAQMAMNGVVSAAVGRPEPLVLFNYLTGTLALVIVAWPAIAAGGLVRLPLGPGDWWYYTGGLPGSLVVIGGALLTQTIGSLLYTLGLVAGQVSGALVMDSLWPTPGVLVGWQTVTGGALTIMALVLASAGNLRIILLGRGGRGAAVKNAHGGIAEEGDLRVR